MGCGPGPGVPLISSEHFRLTRSWYSSRIWASWVGERGSGFRVGIGRRSASGAGAGALLVIVARGWGVQGRW